MCVCVLKYMVCVFYFKADVPKDKKICFVKSLSVNCSSLATNE